MLFLRRCFFLMLILAFALTAVGCSSKVQNVKLASGFELPDALDESWAIAGVALNSNLVLDGVADREVRALGNHWAAFPEAHSSKLYGSFLQYEPQLKLMPYGAVVGQLSEAQLIEANESFALKGDLTTVQLDGFKLALDPVRYLVMARLDETRIATSTASFTESAEMQAQQDRDPHSATTLAGRLASQKRYLEMSMKIYDLYTGQVVWSGEVEKTDSRMLGFDQEASEDVKVERDDQDEPVRIDLEGTPLVAPGMDRAIQDCFDELVIGLMPVEK